VTEADKDIAALAVPQAAPTEGEDELAWRMFPMLDQPLKAVIFWPVVLLTIWGVWFSTDSATLTLLSVVVLFGSLTGYYLPTQFAISRDGVRMQRLFYRREIAWERIKSAVPERDGLFLSPYPVRTRLENYRGIYLPYRSNEAEVIAAVRRFSPELSGLPDE